MIGSKDPYGVLGVSRGASAEEIRNAYRKLARQHHPDVNPGDEQAEAAFKRVTAAYEVLSDEDKRQLYDEFGEDSLRSGFDPEKARIYQQYQAAGSGSGQSFGQSFDFDLSDLFGGMGFGGGGSVPRQPRKEADLHATVELDLNQAVRGAEVSLELPTSQPCADCAGSGQQAGTSATVCSACGGTGQQQLTRGGSRVVATCRSCHGEGRLGTPCQTCGGTGRSRAQRRVTVRIPPGADSGSTMRIAGKGAPSDRGGSPGDLLIETRVRPHPLFRRDGLDLYVTVPVTVAEAYGGSQIEVPTLDGRVKVRVPRGSQPGTRLRLRGKGITRSEHTGDLYVELEVRLPDRYDEKLAKAFRGACSAYSHPVRDELHA